MNNVEFVERIKVINPNITLLTNFTTWKNKIKCQCKVCNTIWESLPGNLTKGKGCPECGKKKRGLKRRKSLELFLAEAKEIHGDAYDYSKVNYTGAYNKICIICPKHGEFWQNPINHIKGCKCPKCSTEKAHSLLKYTTEQFIERAKKVHGDKYNYNKVSYTDVYTPVTIICPKHGEFLLSPNKHINSRQGCPKCSYSHGLLIVYNLLHNNLYNFVELFEVHLKNTIRKTNTVYIDFCVFINNQKYFIEYNGKLHYIPIKYFGGDLKFLQLLYRDEEVRNYCKENGIKLLEIPYTSNDNEIELSIKSFLK